DACLGGECADEYAGRGERGLTARLGRHDRSLGEALGYGAYATLALVANAPAETVLGLVVSAGVTGRGGAHFETAQKWRLAARHDGPKLLVVNAEEGEPGVFKDRHLIEGDPHRVIEGVLIACHTIGADRAYIYINGQARRARAALEAALAEADAAGILDGRALGGAPVAIEVRSGAGGYVCGEESVILNSIEGERPVPRFKPPFATDAGLWGRPTVINNVETICAVTTILDDPPPPTKLIPLSGAIARPGLYEVPVDGATTWAGLLAMAGANPHRTRALLLGGPSGRFVPPEEYEEPLTMRGLGAGGIVVLPLDADIARITRSLAAYNAQESCGECTPCREGTQRLVEFLADPMAYRKEIDDLIEVMSEASLCMLGGMAGRPVTSALVLFPEAFDR
ncbi:MAG: NADH-quinone oxidoreductase subunit E, partial [Chloroflexi bacterium]|nr:NADH-quinone oxidoreductase subunit E [Chloroflexota bacterium]